MTNWRNVVITCKFLVASLYDVNDAAHSMVRSIRFDCLKTPNRFGHKLAFFMRFGTFFKTQAKQSKMKCLF